MYANTSTAPNLIDYTHAHDWTWIAVADGSIDKNCNLAISKL